MPTLIIVSLVLALCWLGHRHLLLRRGVHDLADALQQRRPFLSDDERLPRMHSSWRRLAGEANRLVRAVVQLGQQRADQLSQLQTALGNLQEAVLVLDQDNYVLLANSALQSMFPEARSTVGKRVETVLRSAEFLAYLDDVRDGRASARRQVSFSEPSGAVHVEITGVAVQHDDERSAPWTLFVLHDITRERELETIRRDFVANVSHELKTPLSVIKGYAETLSDDHVTMGEAQRTQFIGAIHRHADRLAAIVEDLLTLSRLETPNPGLQLAVQALEPFIRSATDDFARPVAESGQKLVVVLDDSPTLVADFDQLRLTQVLANLIDNARKYSPSGALIEVGARAVPPENEIEIWVRDTGPGIPAADLPRIFERFYRVEKGRARGTGGTGLGLSIVKHIIQLHGGRVWAESEVGKGTRVAFRLPSSNPRVPGSEMGPGPGGSRSAAASLRS